MPPPHLELDLGLVGIQGVGRDPRSLEERHLHQGRQGGRQVLQAGVGDLMCPSQLQFSQLGKPGQVPQPLVSAVHSRESQSGQHGQPVADLLEMVVLHLALQHVLDLQGSAHGSQDGAYATPASPPC